MQWILQAFDDTAALAAALDRLGLPYSVHKVVPFVGELLPEPVVADPNRVVLFGSHSLWRTAERRGWRPGVFRIAPFAREAAWRPHLLNGPDITVALRDVPARLADDGRDWFVRPVEDDKQIAGGVRPSAGIVEMARKVLALDPADIPPGSLRHDTRLMLAPPARILKEWRVWIVGGRVVAFSLYKEGRRVTYRREIDDDALDFAQALADANPTYSSAYMMDVCRTPDGPENGLRLLETNCINAAGFYAADLVALAAAVDGLGE